MGRAEGLIAGFCRTVPGARADSGNAGQLAFQTLASFEAAEFLRFFLFPRLKENKMEKLMNIKVSTLGTP